MDVDKLDGIERATLELAKDLLRTRDRYHPHDPELAAAFSSKAHEICEDLDIDFGLIESMLGSQNSEISDKLIVSFEAVEMSDPDDDDEISDRALQEILGKQREVVGDQFQEAAPAAESEHTLRISRSLMSHWFGRLQSV